MQLINQAAANIDLSQLNNFYEDPTPEELFKELDEKDFAVPEKDEPMPKNPTTIDKCGVWCKAVLGHLQMLQDARKAEIEKNGNNKDELDKLQRDIEMAHKMILSSPLSDSDRELVSNYNNRNKGGEQTKGFLYQEDFEEVKMALCWKEAEHLEDILFKTFFQLRFSTESQRNEAMQTTLRSLHKLGDACKKMADEPAKSADKKPKEDDKVAQQHSAVTQLTMPSLASFGYQKGDIARDPIFLLV